MRKNTFSTLEKAAKQKEYFHLLESGWSQKEISKHMDISEHTLCKWKKEKGYQSGKRIYTEQEMDKKHNNVPAFIAWLKLNYPAIYTDTYRAYFKDFLKLF